MTLSELYTEIEEYAGDILNSPKYLLTKNYCQHGSISVYDHCLSVAMLALKMANESGWKVDKESLIRGCLLHDYFLYDWHADEKWHSLHGFTHAKRAMKNAQHDFGLNKIEQNMIFSHMFPLNLTHFPRYKESILLCVADKICGSFETIDGLKASLFSDHRKNQS